MVIGHVMPPHNIQLAALYTHWKLKSPSADLGHIIERIHIEFMTTAVVAAAVAALQAGERPVW